MAKLVPCPICKTLVELDYEKGDVSVVCPKCGTKIEINHKVSDEVLNKIRSIFGRIKINR